MSILDERNMSIFEPDNQSVLASEKDIFEQAKEILAPIPPVQDDEHKGWVQEKKPEGAPYNSWKFIHHRPQRECTPVNIADAVYYI